MAKNILIIVEGEKTEPKFFEQLSNVLFKTKFSIYCLKTNIYSLYSKLKEREFNTDIKVLLAEIHPEQAHILEQTFAYTYLIFDCDPHHTKKDDTRELRDVIFDNFMILEELVSYFTDETDPTIGKLYINYPMMESYRDCNAFFDEDYRDSVINISDIKNYKKIVHNKKMSRYDINTYNSSQFKLLMLQNLFKLNKISTNIWQKPNYNEYLQMTDPIRVLNNEKNFIQRNDTIAILNTSLFLVIDYYGNRDNFYDDLSKEKIYI